MLKNYFRTSFRYLQTHKVFSIINLAGLAIGMSVCLFAFLFIQFERSYDSFHSKANRIYRIVTDVGTSTGIDYKGSSYPMAKAIANSFPEVEAATHIALDYYLVQKNAADDNINEVKVAYADATLFEVFDFPLIEGNHQTALNAPMAVVISESFAKKYFGDQNPMGASLLLDGKYAVHINGIMKDIPGNSHLQADMLLSMATLERWNPSMISNWNGKFIFQSYVVLAESQDPSVLTGKFPQFVSRYMDQSRFKYSLALEPLSDIYFKGMPRSSRSGTIVTGNITNVYVVGIVSCFVLFIACFNFINLTTALSIQRLKEVGVRKIIGASRGQLIVQFLTDSAIVSFSAALCALMLCVMLLPTFNLLAGKLIAKSIFDNGRYIAVLFAVAGTIGILAGLFPALFLSRFKPIASLKGKISFGSSGGVRKILVVAQFSISVILIIGTLVVYHQLEFIRSQPLGFDKTNKVVLDFHFEERAAARSIEKLRSIPGVDNISISSAVPGRTNHKLATIIENINHEKDELQIDAYFIDFDFLKQYQIEIIAGRSFSGQLASDSSQAMIINETAVKALGYSRPEDVIGRSFEQAGDKGVIVGVVRDFHFQSLKNVIEPLTLKPSWGRFTFMTFDISDQNMKTTLPVLEGTWKELMPEMPFNYFVLDETYSAQYHSEERFGKIFMTVAFLAIVISCLGLLGLSVFAISRRTKEIGIRKVLGSSVAAIIRLLTMDFLLLVCIAFVLAAPVAWYGMAYWLSDFAYRTTISWWIFAIAGTGAVVIAFITVASIAFRAAVVNPTQSLRAE